MLQQLCDGNFHQPKIYCIPSTIDFLTEIKHVAHTFADSELTLFDQLQDRHGGYQLRDTGNPKQTGRCDDFSTANICKAITASEDELTDGNNPPGSNSHISDVPRCASPVDHKSLAEQDVKSLFRLTSIFSNQLMWSQRSKSGD